MITITIGDAERPLWEATPEWINQQVNRRLTDNASVCIRVRIAEGGATMVLTSEGCPQGSANYRGPNQLEQRIFELWNRHHLNSSHVNGGQLVSFLEQLERLI